MWSWNHQRKGRDWFFVLHITQNFVSIVHIFKSYIQLTFCDLEFNFKVSSKVIMWHVTFHMERALYGLLSAYNIHNASILQQLQVIMHLKIVTKCLTLRYHPRSNMTTQTESPNMVSYRHSMQTTCICIPCTFQGISAKVTFDL